MMAIGLALLSMVCAACNDVVFKLYRRKHRPFGAYFALVGVIWLAVFSMAAAPRTLLDSDAVTLRWGLVSGVFSVASNILLVRAMARYDVGTCATIFRLNLAPAAILAFLLLGEPVTLWKLAGTLAAVVSVFLFFAPKEEEDGSRRRDHILGLGLVVVASLLRAGMGLAYKRGLTLGADQHLMLTWNAVLWLIVGGIYALAVERGTRLSFKTGLYGVVSGALICGIVYFMAAGLKRGDASVVLPVAQLSFVGSALLGVLLLRESMARRKGAGLVLAVLCVLLMAAT